MATEGKSMLSLAIGHSIGQLSQLAEVKPGRGEALSLQAVAEARQFRNRSVISCNGCRFVWGIDRAHVRPFSLDINNVKHELAEGVNAYCDPTSNLYLGLQEMCLLVLMWAHTPE